MDRDDFVTLLKGRLQRATMSSLDAKIATEVQETQKRLEDTRDILPWFLLSEDLTKDTEVGEERVPVPILGGTVRGDFLAEYEQGALWGQNADGMFKPLDKDDYDVLAVLHPDPGRPVAYALGNEYFRLKPTPDAIYPLRMKVYLRDVILSTGGTTNNWLKYASELMLAETGRMIATYYLKDIELAKMMATDAGTAKFSLMLANESRDHAQREYTMGDA